MLILLSQVVKCKLLVTVVTLLHAILYTRKYKVTSSCSIYNTSLFCYQILKSHKLSHLIIITAEGAGAYHTCTKFHGLIFCAFDWQENLRGINFRGHGGW